MYITEEVKELIKEFRKYEPDFDLTEEEAEAIKKEDPNLDFVQDLKDAIIFRKTEHLFYEVVEAFDKLEATKEQREKEIKSYIQEMEKKGGTYEIGNIIVSPVKE